MTSAEGLPRTARVVLRSATRDDVEACVRLETDPDVRRYLGGPSSAETVAAIRASTPKPRWGSYVAASPDTGELLGVLDLKRSRGELEVGYLFLPEHWGKGLAAEAVEALLGWAGETCPETHVIAVTQSANERSAALLDRLGFTERERFVEFGAEQSVFVRPLGGSPDGNRTAALGKVNEGLR